MNTNELALIPVGDKVAISPAAIASRNEILTISLEIEKVESDDDNETCAAIAGRINSLLSEVEKARIELKKPIVAMGKAIDNAANVFRTNLDAEKLRLARLGGDYIAAKEARKRAEEAQRLAELSALERQREAQIAQAQTVEQIETIKADFSMQHEALGAVPIQTIEKPKGQSLRKDWDVQVVNPWELARAHPACVEIKPRLAEIKALLNAGVNVAGVIANRVNKASVRSTATPQIDV